MDGWEAAAGSPWPAVRHSRRDQRRWGGGGMILLLLLLLLLLLPPSPLLPLMPLLRVLPTLISMMLAPPGCSDQPRRQRSEVFK